MKTLPILGLEGWVTDPERLMSHLFKLMFINEYSYTNVFRGQLVSIPYLISTYGHDHIRFSDEVRRAVDTLYTRYFTEVLVNFSVTPDQGIVAASEYDLEVIGTMNGIRYSLHESIKNDSTEAQKRFKAAGGLE